MRKITVDVRELEAPKPLLKAIIAMRDLGDGEFIEFTHRIHPCKLFDEIEKKGFVGKMVHEEPYIVLIAKTQKELELCLAE